MFEQAPMIDFVTIEEAELHIMTLTYNDHNDWRLPTVRELQSLKPELPFRPVCWHQDDLKCSFDMKCALIPVRTI